MAVPTFSSMLLLLQSILPAKQLSSSHAHCHPHIQWYVIHSILLSFWMPFSHFHCCHFIQCNGMISSILLTFNTTVLLSFSIVTPTFSLMWLLPFVQLESGSAKNLVEAKLRYLPLGYWGLGSGLLNPDACLQSQGHLAVERRGTCCQ